MAHLIVRHKVEKYETWREAFESFSEIRKEKGELSFRIFRGAEDSNEVVGIFEWDSLERAKEFIDSDELKEKMENAGVSEKPDVYFSE